MNNVGYILSRVAVGVPPRIEPEHTMLVFGNQRYTYAQMNKKVNKLAYSLTKLGWKKGERVAILLRNCTEWVVSYFALAKLGLTVVPINFMMKAPEIELIMNDSACRHMIVGNDLTNLVNTIKPQLNEVSDYVVVGRNSEDYVEYETLENEGEPLEPGVDVRLDDVLTIQYTSGTTGRPKGAIHTHEGTIWDFFPQIGDFKITCDDVWLCIAALCWVAGFDHMTLATWMMGGTVVLMPSGGLMIDNLLGIIQKERVTSAYIAPTILNRILAFPDVKRWSVDSLVKVTSGGAPIPVSVIERFIELFPNVSFFQCYGLSEHPTIATSLSKEYALSKIGSIGKPTTGYFIKLVDAADREVDSQVAGEICIKSLAVMKGYWNQPEETANTLKGGWLHTGDLAQRDEDGFLYVSGRKKDMIISGGLNVYPAEIEQVISTHPKVAEVAVIGIPDVEWGESGKAIVVLKPGELVTKEELMQLCRDKLANYKVPRQFELTYESLPRTLSGKVKKFELRSREEERLKSR